jgi:hypothetical protein
VKNEDKALLVLTFLPLSYKNLVTTLTYGKTTVIAREVTTTLLSYDQRGKMSVVDGVEISEREGLGGEVQSWWEIREDKG